MNSKFSGQNHPLIASIAASVVVLAGAYVVSIYFHGPAAIKTQKDMSYHTNIVTATRDNENFRHVLFTGDNSQLVIMSIPPGGEVGAETHKYTE